MTARAYPTIGPISKRCRIKNLHPHPEKTPMSKKHDVELTVPAALGRSRYIAIRMRNEPIPHRSNIEFRGTARDGLELIVKPIHSDCTVISEPATGAHKILVPARFLGFEFLPNQFTQPRQHIKSSLERIEGGHYPMWKLPPFDPGLVPLQAIPPAKMKAKQDDQPALALAPVEEPSISLKELIDFAAFFKAWFDPATGWPDDLNDAKAAERLNVTVEKVTEYRRAVYPNSDYPAEIASFRAAFDEAVRTMHAINQGLTELEARYKK
jgi:hypothetical protein